MEGRRGSLGTSVSVRVDTGVSGVGRAVGVSAVCSLGLLVSLVGAEGVLNLVDDSRHVGWLFGGCVLSGLGYQVIGCIVL